MGFVKCASFFLCYHICMIVSDIVKIKKIQNFDNLYIEEELCKVYKNPVRWAIVDMDNEYLTISLSYIAS